MGHAISQRQDTSHFRLLLTQQSSAAQHSTTAPRADQRGKSEASQQPSANSPETKPSDKAQSSDPNAPFSTLPWLGAPPQFQRTWPPSALPQSDNNDDLLLLQAPRTPPKVHKA
jgi:hypothetical protein